MFYEFAIFVNVDHDTDFFYCCELKHNNEFEQSTDIFIFSESFVKIFSYCWKLDIKLSMNMYDLSSWLYIMYV